MDVNKTLFKNNQTRFTEEKNKMYKRIYMIFVFIHLKKIKANN